MKSIVNTFSIIQIGDDIKIKIQQNIEDKIVKHNGLILKEFKQNREETNSN